MNRLKEEDSKFIAQSTNGVIHKQRGQLRGREVDQMTILLNKPYFESVTEKGQKCPKI